jgi:hypothetical protein
MPDGEDSIRKRSVAGEPSRRESRGETSKPDRSTPDKPASRKSARQLVKEWGVMGLAAVSTTALLITQGQTIWNWGESWLRNPRAAKISAVLTDKPQVFTTHGDKRLEVQVPLTIERESDGPVEKCSALLRQQNKVVAMTYGQYNLDNFMKIAAGGFHKPNLTYENLVLKDPLRIDDSERYVSGIVLFNMPIERVVLGQPFVVFVDCSGTFSQTADFTPKVERQYPFWPDFELDIYPLEQMLR